MRRSTPTQHELCKTMTKTPHGKGRWPLLALLFMVLMAVLYRYAPSREEPEWRWVTPGSAVATVLWILGSLLFSWYVSSFASYNETFGSLGGVVVLLMCRRERWAIVRRYLAAAVYRRKEHGHFRSAAVTLGSHTKKRELIASGYTLS